MNTSTRRAAQVVLAATLGGCSLANPIPDITGGEVGGSDAAAGGGASGSGGSSGSGTGGVGASGGVAGSSGTGGIVSGGGTGSSGGTGDGGGTGGGTGGAVGCAASTAELCADFDMDPWDSEFTNTFLAEGGNIQQSSTDSVSSPRSALATVPAVANGVFGAGSLVYTTPASFNGLSLSLDVKLETSPGPEGTSLFLFQLAQPSTSHSGVQLIVGSDAQGLHETPGGFHPATSFTFPSGWVHIEFSMTLSPTANATVMVDGVKWLDAVALTPPALNAPYFAVGIAQVTGPTTGETRVRVDNVVLDFQ